MVIHSFLRSYCLVKNKIIWAQACMTAQARTSLLKCNCHETGNCILANWKGGFAIIIATQAALFKLPQDGEPHQVRGQQTEP